MKTFIKRPVNTTYIYPLTAPQFYGRMITAESQKRMKKVLESRDLKDLEDLFEWAKAELRASKSAHQVEE